MKLTSCRGCGSSSLRFLFSFGNLPYANTFPLNSPKVQNHRLALTMCSECKLVQLDEYPKIDEMFSSYIWKTASSRVVPKYLEKFVQNLIQNFSPKKIIEIASNDGTLIKLLKQKGIEIIGVEPAKNLYDICKNQNLETINDYFQKDFSKNYPNLKNKYDVLIARNVFAHTENILEFLHEAEKVLTNRGICILEFHDGGKLLDMLQFDSIYHEHQSYISLIALHNIVEKTCFKIASVEETFVGGGALLVTLTKSNKNTMNSSVLASKHLGHGDYKTWKQMEVRVNQYSERLNQILKNLKNDFRLIGFGASARSTTLANFTNCWKHLNMIVDSAKEKHGHFWSGTNLKIMDPNDVVWNLNDIIILFAWNFSDEIINQLKNLGFKGKLLKILPNRPILKEINDE